MDSADQVVFVLQLVLALGPLAIYFLALGLVNSQAHPCLINARADFVLLAVAFGPVILAPVMSLVERGWLWAAAAVTVGAASLFFGMMPAREEAWVIYNIERAQYRRIVRRACRRLGWGIRGSDDRLTVTPANLIVSQHGLSWLRNVTVTIRVGPGGGDASARNALIGMMDQEMRRESMLPSATGASLVVIGAGLLGVPMWHLFRHMDAIVDVVRRVLLA